MILDVSKCNQCIFSAAKRGRSTLYYGLLSMTMTMKSFSSLYYCILCVCVCVCVCVFLIDNKGQGLFPTDLTVHLLYHIRVICCGQS